MRAVPIFRDRYLTSEGAQLTPAADSADRGFGPARFFALAALIGAAVLVVLLMFGGDGGYRVTAVFDNAGQLVKGNQVRVGGRPIGTIEKIGLNDSSQAVVELKVDDDLAPLPQGT